MASPIRFGGMASGLDTESIVKELVKAESAPLNRLKRQKQMQEWKQESYREMNSLLLDLQNTVNSIRYAANFNKKIASSENDGIVSSKVVGKPQLSSYTVEVTQTAKAETPAAVEFTTNGLTSLSQSIGNTSAFTINVNGESITVNPGDTVAKLIENVNNSAAGVEASFVDGKLLFKSKTGATKDTNGDGTADFFTTFTVSADNDSNPLGITTTAKTSSTRNAGTPAKAMINGIEYTSNSNTITFDGIEFTVKQTNAGNPIVVTSKTDENSIYESIKSFVDKYNAVIDTINKKISEQKYKGYQPLLDEEIEALPEKTADKMQDMAKSGILLRDPILKSGLDSMRFAIAAPLNVAGVNTRFDTLSEIGVTGPPAGKNAYLENGKLYIDEAKLRKAISENGNDVIKLFTNFSSSSDPATKFKESGIAERLYSKLKTTIDAVTVKAGSSTSIYDGSEIGKNLERIKEDMDTWEDRLQKLEDRYWKQFTAMEKMISQYNSQGSWFAQMLGGGQ